MTTRTVGIDDLGAYTPGYCLDLEALAHSRGVDPAKITIGLGVRAMSVAPPWEDAVTLGANAARRVLVGETQRDEIGMLLVATESAVDHAKPVGIFVHELLGLPASCRTVELKHACYGGTAGLMLAADWVRSGAARGRKALVVATDIARYAPSSSAEFTQGAGAVALVISEAPRLLALDPASGVYAKNVYDFWRPLDRREALVEGKFSVDCYLEALDGALDDWAAVARPSAASLADVCDALLYHTPFPKMAYKAHARLIAHEWRRAGRGADGLADATERTYAALVDPWLTAARRIGNTYTASLFFCLAWLAEAAGNRLPGSTVGLFSYGSGCCAEYFTGRFAPDSANVAAHIGLGEMLAARRALSVEEYERYIHPATTVQPAAGEGPAIRFLGIQDHKRRYARLELQS